MNLWLFLTISTITVFGFVIIVTYIGNQHKLKREELKAKNKNGLNEELEKIKERLSVLEKIVTDKKFDLKEEIDNL